MYEKIERDRILDTIQSVPKQYHFVLSAIMQLDKTGESIFTGDVYNKYEEISKKTRNDVLTQRRVSDILAEFDMLGIINTRVISKGRQGRTREIKLMLSSNIKVKAREIVEKGLGIK